jgi:hypothetical protein
MTLISACSGEAVERPTEASLLLNLELSDGAVIEEVSYVVSGNGMASMQGIIDTSAPGSTASVELFGIPPGRDYLVELEATSVDESVACGGSAQFDVDAGVVSEVTVFLGCKRPQRYGGVRANGKLNLCAELIKAVVSPLQTSASYRLSLSAEGSDEEGDAIEYRWTATGGSIDAAASAATTYTCIEPGDQLITIEVSDDGFQSCLSGWSVNVTCAGEGGEAAPPLVSSDPVAGSQSVRSAWLTLDFAEPVADDVLRIFSLSCDDVAHPISAHRLHQDLARVVVNPTGDLPPDSSCELRWTGPGGPEVLPFFVVSDGAVATVRYDRRDPSAYAPFPDDVWLEPDPATATGYRVELPIPDRESDVQGIMRRLKEAAEATPSPLDGFSPIGPLVVELSDAPEESSMPATQAESLDPFATVGLFDLTTASAGYGQRIPFKLHVRAVRATIDDPIQHAIVIFPSIPLSPGGRYGLVVMKRALAGPDRPFDPSSFTMAALGEAVGGEDGSITEVRALMTDVIDVVSEGSPPVFADDVALALRFSVRSNESFPLTQRTMKEQVLSLPAPSVEITSVRPDFGDVAAIVEGTWQAPEWRVSFSIARFEDGSPVVIHQKPIPFILAIPHSAVSTPAPITMYQHGNPGSAEDEVPWQARSYMAENGFAVAGFTDTISRDVASDTDLQRMAIMTPLFGAGIMPDYWYQTTGEQLSFIRMLPELADLDVLPLGQPDGEPDLDVSAPLTYLGLSEGANKGQAFVPYAPEVRAATLLVGGMRYSEILFHQDPVNPGGVGTPLLDILRDLLSPNLRPLDLWVGFGLFQLAFDPQDPHNHAAFMYANPFEVAGTLRKPSVLVQEGIADTLVPNNATRSLAYTLGRVPHIEPIQVFVPYLPTAPGPIMGNIDFETTSAFAQYVPVGIPGLAPTPTCEFQPEGHFCAQIADAAIEQRVRFFQTALTDQAPTITNPFN